MNRKSRVIGWLGGLLVVGGTVLLFVNEPDGEASVSASAETPRSTVAVVTEAPAPRPARSDASPAPYGGLAEEPGADGVPAADTALPSVPDLVPLLAQYESATRFPPGSQPIDASSVEASRPNRSVDVSQPFPLAEGEPPVRVSLQLDRFIYFAEDTLLAVVGVGGRDDLGAVSARLRVVDLLGNEVWQGDSSRDAEGLFSLAIPMSVLAERGIFGELLLQAIVHARGEKLLVAAPFRLEEAVVQLEAVLPAYIGDSGLNIPLQFAGGQPGYYFVSANLYSQSTGEPLLRLEAEGRLNGSEGRLEFEAHASALRAQGDAGPYWLQDVSIERAAEEGEQRDRPGRSRQARYPVEGFALDAYPEVRYEDPLAEDRKAFLQKLGEL